MFFEGRVQHVLARDGQLRISDGRWVPEEEAPHLAPCVPSKIVAMHLNLDARRIENRDPAPPATPNYFLKPPTSVNAHHGVLHRPQGHHYLNYEGELAVVVGQPLFDVRPDDAWAAIAGFTVANDVGLHDYRDTDNGSMLRVKGQDGFCPLGPGLVSGVDVRESTLRTYVNGAVVQEGSIADLLFDPGYVLSDLSRHMTLLPGDVVLLGTPANSRPMNVGDVVEVEVTGVGRLSNRIAERPDAAFEDGHRRTDSDNVRRIALMGDYWAARDAEVH
ncbi:fumarylacetoacetate hydrolase family protein [Streptomyces sp. NBC_00258]|nr:fumarylacetoacetate hydrolase family protein [Streptomyces sp. NBC_00258]